MQHVFGPVVQREEPRERQRVGVPPGQPRRDVIAEAHLSLSPEVNVPGVLWAAADRHHEGRVHLLSAKGR